MHGRGLGRRRGESGARVPAGPHATPTSTVALDTEERGSLLGSHRPQVGRGGSPGARLRVERPVSTPVERQKRETGASGVDGPCARRQCTGGPRSASSPALRGAWAWAWPLDWGRGVARRGQSAATDGHERTDTPRRWSDERKKTEEISHERNIIPGLRDFLTSRLSFSKPHLLHFAHILVVHHDEFLGRNDRTPSRPRGSTQSRISRESFSWRTRESSFFYPSPPCLPSLMTSWKVKQEEKLPTR